MIAPDPAYNHASPSLSTLRRAPGGGQAYELKFLLDEAAVAPIEDWARARLALDPHCEVELGGAYRITTLYLDTPALDVYHRTRSYGRRKFRIRRYGLMSSAFLERKTKSRDRVAKRRTEMPASELARLAAPLNGQADEGWQGDWFHERIVNRGLLPASRITYRRTAYVGECAEGPLRLTLDREIRGVLSSDWSLASGDDGLPLLNGHVILELKFLRSLPLPFKELVRDFRLNPAAISKYRLCREAWGVNGVGAVAGGEVARA